MCIINLDIVNTRTHAGKDTLKRYVSFKNAMLLIVKNVILRFANIFALLADANLEAAVLMYCENNCFPKGGDRSRLVRVRS